MSPAYKTLFQPIFIAALVLYAILFALKKTGLYIPLISDYAADVLAMPVVLTLALFAERAFRAFEKKLTGEGMAKTEMETKAIPKAVPPITFSPLKIAFGVAFYSLLFEYVFPHMTDRFTADPWDVLAYATGGLIYALFLNGAPKKS